MPLRKAFASSSVSTGRSNPSGKGDAAAPHDGVDEQSTFVDHASLDQGVASAKTTCSSSMRSPAATGGEAIRRRARKQHQLGARHRRVSLGAAGPGQGFADLRADVSGFEQAARSQARTGTSATDTSPSSTTTTTSSARRSASPPARPRLSRWSRGRASAHLATCTLGQHRRTQSRPTIRGSLAACGAANDGCSRGRGGRTRVACRAREAPPETAIVPTGSSRAQPSRKPCWTH